VPGSGSVVLLGCEQCGCLSDDEAQGWVGYLAVDVNGMESTTVAFFCPSCAREQFGYRARRESDERGSA
jgi:hypothetical protein